MFLLLSLVCIFFPFLTSTLLLPFLFTKQLNPYIIGLFSTVIPWLIPTVLFSVPLIILSGTLDIVVGNNDMAKSIFFIFSTAFIIPPFLINVLGTLFSWLILMNSYVFFRNHWVWLYRPLYAFILGIVSHSLILLFPYPFNILGIPTLLTGGISFSIFAWWWQSHRENPPPLSKHHPLHLKPSLFYS